MDTNIIYRTAGKFGGEFNLAVKFTFRQINFRHIRTQELRNEILLRDRKLPNLNSANNNYIFERLEAKSPNIIPAKFSGYTVYTVIVNIVLYYRTYTYGGPEVHKRVFRNPVLSF